MKDTPRTNEWETYCDECYYHMWRVRRKNERGFNDGYHVHNGDEARALVDLLNKQDSELNAARAEIEAIMETLKSPIEVELDMIRGKIAIPDRSELEYITQLKAVTEQRDRAWQKIENQAERITYLEGATNHATGTPLSKAIKQRDRLAEAMTRIIRIYENPEKGCIPSSSDMYDEALQSLTTNA